VSYAVDLCHCNESTAAKSHGSISERRLDGGGQSDNMHSRGLRIQRPADAELTECMHSGRLHGCRGLVGAKASDHRIVASLLCNVPGMFWPTP
jgi:hypothetical protein